MALTRVNYSRQGNFPIDKLPSITNDKLSGSISTAKLADNSVTTAKIADAAVTNNKSGMPNHLKPVWINYSYNAGGNSSHRFVSNYGKKIYSNNGNNGGAIHAMLDGSTGTGNFIIEYIPGYYWGWSGIYLRENGSFMKDTDGNFTSGVYTDQPTGFKQFWTGNNSSNNARYCTYWNGSSSTVLLNASGGTNGATWYVWRASGVLSLSDSVGTTQLFASGDTTDYIIVSSTAQSVSSCEIISARRQV